MLSATETPIESFALLVGRQFVFGSTKTVTTQSSASCELWTDRVANAEANESGRQFAPRASSFARPPRTHARPSPPSPV
jgi:hypothetical protein